MRKWRPIFWRALAFYRAQRWLICCKRLSQTPLYLVGAARLAVLLYCLRRRALPARRCGTPRAFFSRFSQGASAKTVCTIRRARSDTGKITEKCSSMPDTCETETLLTRYLDSLTHERKLSAHTLRGY